MLFISEAMAQTAEATPDAGASAMFNIGFIVLLFVFFYFLMIRPQQKRLKEQQNMLSELAKGDKVITNGGIIGKITKVNDEDVELEIAKDVKVTVLRYSVYKKYDNSEFAKKTADKKEAKK